jgi:predicted nucleic acid-binding protein
MKLLLDTNVTVDIIAKRDGYEDSLKLLKYCEINRVEGYVSTTTITDLMYILRKHIARDAVRDAVQTLITIVDVAVVTKSDIIGAFANGMKDFEDAVQAQCAKHIKADYIVTHNLKDFEKSPVLAISPTDALAFLKI